MKRLDRTMRSIFGVMLLLATSYATSQPCQAPPVGDNLARGCYVQSTLWSNKTTSITLWQPAKSWRGDWQDGDKNKDAAVLVFNQAGQSRLIKQWCKESCFSIGGATLTLPHIQAQGRRVIWLADPPKGSREGAIGDVISVNQADGSTSTLAKDQRLLTKSDGSTLSEIKRIGSCSYVIPDAWFPVTPSKTTVPGGYLNISHPQPIALTAHCPDLAVKPDSRASDLTRLARALGSGRMRQANQYLKAGEWVVKGDKLFWVESGALELLE